MCDSVIVLCFTVRYFCNHSGFVIMLMGKRELVATKTHQACKTNNENQKPANSLALARCGRFELVVRKLARSGENELVMTETSK